jgi:DNA-binding LacI/PurR family transcriptional regulator
LHERDIQVISTAQVDPNVGAALLSDVGALQVRYLAHKGHRKIAFAQTDDEALGYFARQRLTEVLAACQAQQLPTPPLHQFALDGSNARVVIERWHAEEVTAICAYNDEVAHAVLYGIRAAHLHCPGDMAVIGVDDIPVSAVSVPPLTSIGWDDQAVSRHLTNVLLAALGQKPDVQVASDMAVVLRERESA